MIGLRDYQLEVLADVRSALRHHDRVLLQLPTGAGKTKTAIYMLAGAITKGKRTWFTCHRTELVDQTSAALEEAGLDHGFCAAGKPPRYSRAITVCSVDTLRGRMDRLPEPDFIVVDEAHHSTAGTWRKIFEHYPRAKFVGLSATPERLDGRGLDELFTSLVVGPSTAELIEEGYLSNYKLLSQPRGDFSGIKMRGADYDAKEMTAALDKPHILGDAVQTFRETCPHAQAVVFCVSVEHALHVRDAFKAAGFVAEELDGGADRRTRIEVMRAFRQKRIQILTSVDLFGEGTDIPELDAVILLRPTKSLGLYLQQVGRALRVVYAPGHDLSTREGRLAAIAAGNKPTAYILDHVGNFHEHGSPHTPREWTLQGRAKRGRKSSAPVKTCGTCFGTVPAAATECPYCHAGFEGQPREVEQVEGRLVEIDVSRFRRQQKQEVGQAKTREELERIAAQRGYKPAWVEHILKARQRKAG